MAKTKIAAKTQYNKRLTIKHPGIVYQFPRGHWSCCSLDSPVGLSLMRTGYIYPNVYAKNWEFFNFD